MTRVLKPEVVADVGARHAEGPIWDPLGGRLLWVDVAAGRLHFYDPSTRIDQFVEVGSPLGAAAPRAAGGFVLAIEDGFALLDAPDAEPRLVARIEHGPGPETRMNDGKCDPQGCFWAGSMAYDCAPGHGALYRLDARLHMTRLLEKVTISNGLDWSADGRTLWYIDTLSGASFSDVMAGRARLGIDAFQVDPDTGALSDRRRLFDVPTQVDAGGGMTLLDGMTIDAEGFVWVAAHGSGQVRRYSPRGDVDAVVEMPVECPTSVAFGGDRLDDLYITTMTPQAAPGADPRTPILMWEPKPLEGALFRCRPGVRGRTPGIFAG